MRLRIHRPGLKRINTVLFLIIIALIGFILLYPIDVLSCPDDKTVQCNGDWYIHVDTSKEYALGDELIAISEFTKERASNGHAAREIECKNNDGDFATRHDIGESDARRAVGHGRNDAYLRVPIGLQGQLPNTCRIAITVEYPINRLRDFIRGKHIEYAYSNEFTVVKPAVPVVEVQITVLDNGEVIENAPVTVRGFAREAPVTPQSPDAPQAPSEPQSPTPQPNPPAPEETPGPPCDLIQLNVLNILRTCL